MLLKLCLLGVTMSWDDGLLGARASRPHKASRSLAISPTGINRQRRHGSPSAWPMRFPPTEWAACCIALKLSQGQWDRMRAGRPRSQEMPSRPCSAPFSRRKLCQPSTALRQSLGLSQPQPRQPAPRPRFLPPARGASLWLISCRKLPFARVPGPALPCGG